MLRNFLHAGRYRSYSSSPLAIEHLKGEHTGITVLSLNRPEARNAMGKEMMEKVKQRFFFK